MMLISTSVSAVTIDFGGEVVNGPFFGPSVEDGIDYDLLPGSGGLWTQTISLPGENITGNPVPHMEGLLALGGGTLRMVRSDGGTFQFDAADIAQHILGVSQVIDFEGLLGGVSQAIDSFATSATVDVWTTVSSANLSGIVIDELRIRLDSISDGWESLDNVDLTFTSVPEPTTLLLLTLGLAGLGVARKRLH